MRDVCQCSQTLFQSLQVQSIEIDHRYKWTRNIGVIINFFPLVPGQALTLAPLSLVPQISALCTNYLFQLLYIHIISCPLKTRSTILFLISSCFVYICKFIDLVMNTCCLYLKWSNHPKEHLKETIHRCHRWYFSESSGNLTHFPHFLKSWLCLWVN